MIDLNKIYCENCLETMSRMENDFVDLVVTSPPYDNLRDYKGYSFDFEAIAKELYRVIKPGGVLVWVVNDSTVNGSETVTSCKQKIFFREECGFNVHDTMIYEKNGPRFPDAVRYYDVFEYMFILSKGKPKTFNPIADRKNTQFGMKWTNTRTVRKKDGSRKREPFKPGGEYGVRFNIWRILNGAGYTSKDEISFEHPATFPEKLAAPHIESWCNPGDLVYDPFGGSGTTAKMAHLANRNWILSEISSEYCDIAEKRISPYLNQQKLQFA